MVHFGGTLTLNNVVIAYIGLNADKVMIGRRFLGVDAIGIYGRGEGFQLASIPTDNLNFWAVGEVAFSALSRLQNDPGLVSKVIFESASRSCSG